MEQQISTRVLFGKGYEDNIGKLLKDDGIKSVIFVYGSSSIKSSGLYTIITTSLKNHNIEVIESASVETNPTATEVDRYIKENLNRKASAILAVGGGSVLDSGKAIACGVYNKESIDSIINGANITGALPLYTVQTIPGTGSEVNSSFVIMEQNSKQKHYINCRYTLPVLSILNPELTLTVPPNYTSYSAITIFSNILKILLSEPFDKDKVELFYNHLTELKDITESILINPWEYDSRAEFMKVSTKVVTDSPENLFTIIGNQVAGIFNIPYGAALSMVIPAWVKVYKDEKRLSNFLLRVFKAESISQGVETLEKWLHGLGSPIRFSEYNIDKPSFDKIAENSWNQVKALKMDSYYTKEAIKDIIELSE